MKKKNENSINPILKRILKKIDVDNEEINDIQAAHSSHSSGTGGGHSSYVSSTLRVDSKEEKKKSN